MNMDIEYSVIIRTTGNAQEKYHRLLSSIKQLDPSPYETIVVLPNGSKKPKQSSLNEKYYFCEKGMIRQRLYGIEQCKTRYALICDDDVVFNSDFVKKLYEPIAQQKCSFSAGPLYSFLPPKGVNAVFSAFVLNAVPTIFHRNRYVSIISSGGYSYNRHLGTSKIYETQSVAWTCFFADLKAFQCIDFDQEVWLDSHGYSSLDDQTMFYKAWIRGLKTVVVSDAYYEHLDARTSLINNNQNAVFSLSFNRVVFWHRFIFTQKKNIFFKGVSYITFHYRLLCLHLLDVLNVKRGRLATQDLLISKEGAKSAFKYIKSSAYRSLSPVNEVQI